MHMPHVSAYIYISHSIAVVHGGLLYWVRAISAHAEYNDQGHCAQWLGNVFCSPRARAGNRSRLELHAVLQPRRRIPASSTKLTMTQKTDGDVVYMSLGTPGGHEVFVQPQLALPRPHDEKVRSTQSERASDPKEKADDAMFASYFWAVPIGSADAKQEDKCNMKVEFDDVTVVNMKVKVPIMTNTRPLDVGDRLIVEPYNKKPKRA